MSGTFSSRQHSARFERRRSGKLRSRDRRSKFYRQDVTEHRTERDCSIDRTSCNELDRLVGVEPFHGFFSGRPGVWLLGVSSKYSEISASSAKGGTRASRIQAVAGDTDSFGGPLFKVSLGNSGSRDSRQREIPAEPPRGDHTTWTPLEPRSGETQTDANNVATAT